MGLGVALHDNTQMRLNYTFRYASGAFCISFFYFLLNEINNGFLMRNGKKEQYFFTHGTSCILTLFILTNLRSTL